MWLVVNDEMWNLDNVEGIVREDNRVILIYPDHMEKFDAVNGASDNVLVELEVAMKSGQKVFSGCPNALKARSEECIYDRFG